MNVYEVRIPEERADTPSVCDLEPPEPWWPWGLFAAETPSQAKYDALRAWTRSLRSGVYSDDWPALRVRLVEADVEVERGELLEYGDGAALFSRLSQKAFDQAIRLGIYPREVAA